MTSKEFVLERFPKARAERHIQGMIKGLQRPYWLIRDGRNVMYIASGKSESNAWVNAKKVIRRTETEKKE